MFPQDWLQYPQMLLQQQEWLLGLGIDWSQIVQIAILALFAFWIYTQFVRRSHAEQLLKGLFVILLLFIGLFSLAYYFKLNLLVTVFGFSIQILIFALIVIFQPELRRILLYLGQPELFGERLFSLAPPERKAEYLISELTDAVRFLSKSKTGALVVLESATNPGGNYLEAGTPLDARLSTELLLTIFHPNTPLHDGAVIIDPDNRIVAAGVLLPLTEDPKLSWQYGTRHRAALGLTEVSDSTCIVVSEETGNVSLIQSGTLEKMGGADDLKKRLEKLYNVHLAKTKDRKVISFSERVSDFLSGGALPDRLQRIFMRRQNGDFKKVSKKTDKTPLPKSGSGGTP